MKRLTEKDFNVTSAKKTGRLGDRNGAQKEFSLLFSLLFCAFFRQTLKMLPPLQPDVPLHAVKLSVLHSTHYNYVLATNRHLLLNVEICNITSF